MKKKNVFKLVGHRDNFPFFKEILEMGYHVFSMENAKLPGFYPKGGIHFAPVIFHDRVDGLAALVTMPRYVVGFICTACSTSR